MPWLIPLRFARVLLPEGEECVARRPRCASSPHVCHDIPLLSGEDRRGVSEADTLARQVGHDTFLSLRERTAERQRGR